MPSTTPIQELRHDTNACVTASIGFLEKDPTFEDEEPYAFRYKADMPIPLTNMRTEHVDVRLCDLRGQENIASLNSCGFEIRKLRSTMSYEQFALQDAIDNIYLKNLRVQLLEDYNATDLDFPRVRVRRRNPSFPHSTGVPYSHHQPSTAAHIDLTTSSAQTKVQDHRKQDSHAYLARPFQIINVWKPLRGPLEDWPLAVCDASTVDVRNDMAEASIIYEDYVNQNCQVHFSDTQKWYYLRNQQHDELLIFRQYDSQLGHNNGI